MIFTPKKSRKKTVFVGVSGGVDSSISAKRLVDQGFTVVGAFMKTWYPDWLPCDWKAERRDAMRVCAQLNIPFVEYDLGETYFNEVGMHMVNEYKAGRTPNPDVMCNRHVKFNAFWKAAKSDGANFIATGHYATKTVLKNYACSGELENFDSTEDLHVISKAIDQNKDQTYFLWGVDPAVVPKMLLPIGDTSKSGIRKEATRSHLITANKPDSQGICFLGHVDLTEFLSHYIDLVPGKVLDTAGKVIGNHNSAVTYTIGQRHGFNLDVNPSVALYVINKNVIDNTLIVGTIAELNESTSTNKVQLADLNLFMDLHKGQRLQARFRYRQNLIDVEIDEMTGKQLTIKFDECQSGIAPGQSLVIYNDKHMVGGGIIQ